MKKPAEKIAQVFLLKSDLKCQLNRYQKTASAV